MKTPLALSLMLFGTALAASAQVYVQDDFDYADGALGAPWDVTAGGPPNSTITVEAASTWNDFTPSGKQVEFARINPGSSISARLFSGENPGTTVWTVTPGDRVRYSADLNISVLTGSHNFQMLLMAQGQTNPLSIGGVRFQSAGSNNAVIQTMSTNSVNSFTTVQDSPTLSGDTWYRVVIDLEVIDTTHTSYDLSIEQLGTGGGIVYSGTNFEVATSGAFGDEGGIILSSGTGFPTFDVADVSLVAIPEPSQAALLTSALLLCGVVLHRRRKLS